MSRALGSKQRCDSLLPRVPNPHVLLVFISTGSNFFTVGDLWFFVVFFFFCIPVDKCNFVPLLGKDNIPGQSRIGGFTEVPFFTDFFFKVFLKHCVLAVLGLHCHSQAFSGASAWGLTSRGGTWASRYSGISCGARALGSGTLGAQAQWLQLEGTGAWAQ